MNTTSTQGINTLDEFIQACLEYNEIHHPDLSEFKVCPVHIWATTHTRACYSTIQSIKNCPLCHKPMCPQCGRHNVTQLSRVTGYVSTVSGWNEAKQQELKDRKRYELKGLY